MDTDLKSSTENLAQRESREQFPPQPSEAGQAGGESEDAVSVGEFVSDVCEEGEVGV